LSVVHVSDEFEAAAEPVRRSTRLVKKPVHTDDVKPSKAIEVEGVKLSKRRKRERNTDVSDVDDDIQFVSGEVAPIFLTRKWAEEFQVVKKAKQEFLFSGVPEVLKQKAVVQLELEQRPVEIFPRISHVTQFSADHKPLPYPEELKSILSKPLPLQKKIQRPTTFPSSLNSPLQVEVATAEQLNRSQTSPLDWRFCKDWISGLKEEHNLDFPFFRVLRALLAKSNSDHQLWTDAYAPTNSLDVLANRKSIQYLKNWLNKWKLRAGEEVVATPKKKKKPPAVASKAAKRKRINSEGLDIDDIEVVVEEKSNSEWSSNGDIGEDELWNCVLLMGPAGCGKTASIYALAQELGFNVLEVNASSRRNGKSILSHLHEATQSHSLSSSNSASSMSKLFAAKTTAQDSRSPLSLVLFEDVDIVFESEDESFYSALSTLIGNTKRPIVLTLGSKQERDLLTIKDKIRTCFDVVRFASPDLLTTCGYVWCLCLSKGYPLDWNTLHSWLQSRAETDLDLRSILLDLQMQLDHHPLRSKLDFDQLQLKAEETTSAQVATKKKRPLKTLPKNHIERIKIATRKTQKDWPYVKIEKPLRFVYDTEQDLISPVGGPKTFSRILLNDDLYESDSGEEAAAPEHPVTHVTLSALPPAAKQVEWKGDLTALGQSFDYRASGDVFDAFVSSSQLSWASVSLFREVQQMMTDHSSKLAGQQLDFSDRDSLEAVRDCDGISNRNKTLLGDCISRNLVLQHRGNQHDVLPYVRSMIRSDLVHNLSKRRRKPRSSQSTTTRLPSLDLILATSDVVQLSNAL